MKEYKSYQRIKTVMLSSFIVILIFILINGLSMSLSKMENTMSPIPYKVFYLEGESPQKLALTFLNNKFILDFNRFLKIKKQNEEYNVFIPSSLRVITHGLKLAENLVSTRVCELLLK